MDLSFAYVRYNIESLSIFLFFCIFSHMRFLKILCTNINYVLFIQVSEKDLGLEFACINPGWCSVPSLLRRRMGGV